jgi:proline iminopeptidase
MQVSEIHEIYFEQCGNPDGVPVFVLHGGSWGTTLALAHRHDTKPVPHAWIKTVRTC